MSGLRCASRSKRDEVQLHKFAIAAYDSPARSRRELERQSNERTRRFVNVTVAVRYVGSLQRRDIGRN